MGAKGNAEAGAGKTNRSWSWSHAIKRGRWSGSHVVHEKKSSGAGAVSFLRRLHICTIHTVYHIQFYLMCYQCPHAAILPPSDVTRAGPGRHFLGNGTVLIKNTFLKGV